MKNIIWKGCSFGGTTKLRVNAFGEVERLSTYQGWTIHGVCSGDAVHALKSAISAITLQYGSIIKPVE